MQRKYDFFPPQTAQTPIPMVLFLKDSSCQILEYISASMVPLFKNIEGCNPLPFFPCSFPELHYGLILRLAHLWLHDGSSKGKKEVGPWPGFLGSLGGSLIPVLVTVTFFLLFRAICGYNACIISRGFSTAPSQIYKQSPLRTPQIIQFECYLLES